MTDPMVKIEAEVADRRLEPLRALEAERQTLLLVVRYTTMHTAEQLEHAKKRLPEVRALIEAEKKRLASFRSEGLAERQLEDSQQMIAANGRIARWTAVAATGSLLAAIAAAIAAWASYRK